MHKFKSTAFLQTRLNKIECFNYPKKDVKSYVNITKTTCYNIVIIKYKKVFSFSKYIAFFCEMEIFCSIDSYF